MILIWGRLSNGRDAFLEMTSVLVMKRQHLTERTSLLVNAGHEFVALGWLLEQASPAIARTLKAIPDASAAAVVIPDIPGIPPQQLYRHNVQHLKIASSPWPTLTACTPPPLS
jgi:hypothetical protein